MEANLNYQIDMIYCASRIETYFDELPVSVGTGFFYNVQISDTLCAPHFVTNKHVILGSNRARFHLHLSETMENPCACGTHSDFHYVYGDNAISHPNKHVDLCAIPIGSLLNQANKQNCYPYIRAISKENIPSKSEWRAFAPIQQIKMIGYPNGLYDSHNNFPIVRQGITATSIAYSYNGKPEFLVDLACFPGSSGSPIFIHNEGVFFDERSKEMKLGSRRIFVGILYAGPLMNHSGQIELGKAKNFTIDTTMHLGQAIRADQLLAFDEHYNSN